MDEKRIEEIKENMKSKDTSELLEIWKSRDRQLYVDEAFEAVKLLLRERNVQVPEQSESSAVSGHLEKAYRYFREEKDSAKALRECNLAAAREPSNANAHNLRGIILAGSGRPAEAIQAYKKALEIEPGFTEARENLDYLESALKSVHNLTTVATFNLPSDAYIARMALEREGIWSFLADEETLYAAPHLSFAVGGARLRVKPEDAGRALKVINRVTGNAEE